MIFLNSFFFYFKTIAFFIVSYRVINPFIPFFTTLYVDVGVVIVKLKCVAVAVKLFVVNVKLEML